MSKRRLISLAGAVVIYCAAWLVVLESPEDRLFFLLYLAFCILLIWYGDFIGGLTGTHFGDLMSPRVTKATPGRVVRFFGWCLLIIPFLFIIARRLSAP